jgi:hypothetical protein
LLASREGFGRLVKKFEGLEKARLAGSTSLFGLLGSQDEFLDPTAGGAIPPAYSPGAFSAAEAG